MIIGIKVILTVNRRERKDYRIGMKMKHKQVATREGDPKLCERLASIKKGSK